MEGGTIEHIRPKKLGGRSSKLEEWRIFITINIECFGVLDGIRLFAIYELDYKSDIIM